MTGSQVYGLLSRCASRGTQYGWNTSATTDPFAQARLIASCVHSGRMYSSAPPKMTSMGAAARCLGSEYVESSAFNCFRASGVEGTTCSGVREASAFSRA